MTNFGLFILNKRMLQNFITQLMGKLRPLLIALKLEIQFESLGLLHFEQQEFLRDIHLPILKAVQDF